VEYPLGEFYDERTELCRFDDFEREGHPDEVRGDPLEGDSADCHARETGAVSLELGDACCDSALG
jgi:hypothetical protein